MNNFLEFIQKDIDAKKSLIETLPTKTKTNKKKYNQILDDIKDTYEQYKSNLKNYLIAKSRKLEIEDEKDNIDKLKEKIESLENLKFLLNPSNTYFEKMGFDGLLYKIDNFNTFNFDSLNDIINEFLDKFELVGISLKSNDFNYTCYVHEYMASFLDVRYRIAKNYNKVSEIFEQIYWVNPELINHIALNFRKLIKEHEKKFESYILSLQKQVMEKNNITDYASCLEKLQSLYVDLNIADVESISEIINSAKKGRINIEQYFEDNKIRKSAFNSLIPESVDLDNSKEMDKICRALDKLKLNIEEYKNYIEFKLLFDFFKEKYSPIIPKLESKETKDSKDSKNQHKESKEVEEQINKKEVELQKLNKKIFGGRPGLFEFKNDNDLNRLKRESVFLANELCELYKKYDTELFEDKIMDMLSSTLTVSDILNLYYSHDYHKKIALQNVYNLKDYDSIVKFSENFDLFAMNPTNIIVTGVTLFKEMNIAQIIANKYRLNNIKITEDDLGEENLTTLLNKILLILRVNHIENSNISIEEIWFIAEVEKIINTELKKNVNV